MALSKYQKFYNIYRHMLNRCYHLNEAGYQDYGGRGIIVCDRWKIYDNFKLDMWSSYQEGLSIDRINNNGNYEPSNVRWATRKEQSNNRRSNRWFTINGISKTLAQWSDGSSVKSSTIRQRIYVYKWPIEKALEMEKR